jgi:hypothetical protein
MLENRKFISIYKKEFNMPTLILVHIGDKFSDYINDCILQIQSVTSISIQVLINKQHAEKISSGVQIFFLEDIPKSENHKKFESMSKLNSTFRGGFWKFATQRFFYLYDHVLNKNLTDVFHIENDNLIYMDFLEKLEIFQKKNMWCVMDSQNRCIPSFLYFKNSDILYKLTESCLNNSIKGLTDMESLAIFRHLNKNEVGLLPIVKDYIDIIDPDFFENIIYFNCIFDAACVGQFIGGVDPNNKTGDTTGFINETSIIKCNKVKIYFRDNKPYLNDVPMANLHIHSKDLKRWTSL